MKKGVVLLVLLALFSMVSATASAEPADTVDVYVTIADKDGNLVLAQQPITVVDADKDGKFTIDDALYAAHEAKYTGGAAAGYASSVKAYGLSMDKLWGAANGDGYGYCVNNVSAISLADEVKAGAHINAYVYTDTVAFSDTYCYFNAFSVTCEPGEEITLVLMASAYDAAWNPITVPVEGAAITIDGEKTAFKTDKDGKVTLTMDAAGSYVISAVSDTMTLVPPVCKVTVKTTATTTAPTTVPTTQASPITGRAVGLSAVGVLTAVSLIGLALSRKRGCHE